MRRFMFAVLDFAIRHLIVLRNRFAEPVPAHRYRVLMGYRRVKACEEILKSEPWTIEEILAREG